METFYPQNGEHQQELPLDYVDIMQQSWLSQDRRSMEVLTFKLNRLKKKLFVPTATKRELRG